MPCGASLVVISGSFLNQPALVAPCKSHLSLACSFLGPHSPRWGSSNLWLAPVLGACPVLPGVRLVSDWWSSPARSFQGMLGMLGIVQKFLVNTNHTHILSPLCHLLTRMWYSSHTCNVSRGRSIQDGLFCPYLSFSVDVLQVWC